jgi:hypothetical protein
MRTPISAMLASRPGRRAMHPQMPSVALSDDELVRAAIAARSLAFMHEEKAKSTENGGLHVDQAKRYQALAERFECARRSDAE